MEWKDRIRVRANGATVDCKSLRGCRAQMLPAGPPPITMTGNFKVTSKFKGLGRVQLRRKLPQLLAER